MAKTTNPENEISQELQKTDFGQWVEKNKNLIMIAGVAIVIAVILFSFLTSKSSESNVEHLNEIYQVKASTFTPYLEGKTKIDEFLPLLEKIDKKVLSDNSFMSTSMKTAAALIKDTKVTQAISLLEAQYNGGKVSDERDYIVGMKLMNLYEDNSNVDKAISANESLLAYSNDAMKDYLYYNLGRLYKDKGNVEKAKSNLNYVLEKHKDGEYAGLASALLSGLK